jgi:phospholipid/cholesterol/gamma-HCH transport system substrate-binding protein
VGLLLFVGACFAIASYYFSLAGTTIIPGSTPYRVQAVIPNAVSLAPAADVRQAGVNVGKVTRIGGTGAQTILAIELDSHSPVYRDAQVYVRAKSIAGENYVELDPGTPSAGAVPSGGLIGIDHAQEATQIDQLFSVFDRARRRDLQRALYGLGGGLSQGGRDLNRTLEAAAALPNEASPAARVLANDRSQLGGLIDSFGQVTRALGERSAGIRMLTRQVNVAATAVAARDAKLRALLDVLPAFLRQANATADHLKSFSYDATPVVHNLRLAAQDLVPTARVLIPAARQGQTTMRELDRFALAAAPALGQLRPFAANARQFVPPLTGFLRQVKPMVTYLDPFRREISTFFALDAASFQSSDALGHVARIVLPVSRSDLAGVLTSEQEQLLQKLSGSLDTRGTNAYPAPGGAAGSTPFSGAYPRLEPDPPYAR